MHVYPADALFADRTAEPVGARSLTDSEIVQLYQWWLLRPPSADEMQSERENSNKYSAAGIERQIANRAGNVSGSGVRGDEGLRSLTVAAPIIVAHSGSVAASGPAAIAPTADPQTGPLGLSTPGAQYPYPSQYYGAAPRAGLGLSVGTLAIGAAVIGAAWFLAKGHH